MVKKLLLKSLLLLCALVVGSGSACAADVTGTINFSNASGATKISSASVTGNDSQGNTWTITTVGTTSYTANSSYYQVGSSSNPATSITFTTTLPDDVNIKSMSAKFGGFSNTVGTVTLKVGDTTIGTGSLNGGTDVTVSNSSTATGKVLTVTVTNIAKGVKVYYISYTYSSSPLSSITLSGDYPTSFYQGDEFTHEGMTVTATYEDNSTSNVTNDATFSGYDMSTVGDQTVTVSYTEDGITKSTTYDITVTPFPAYTVSFSDGGSVTETTGHAGVTLPTRQAPEGYQFAGWSTTDVPEGTANVTIIPTGTYYPVNDITLYPVYSSTTTQTEEQWLEISTAPTDGVYAICSASYFMKAAISSSRFSNGSATPQIANNKLSTAPANDCRWEIYKAADNYYRIKNGTNYAASTGTKNQGALATDESAEKAKWTISYSSSSFVIENVSNKTSKVNCTLRNNGTYGWATYAEDTGNAPRLFKQTQVEVSVTVYTSHLPFATIVLNAACTDGSMVYSTYSNSSAFIVSDDIIVSEIKVEGGKLKVSNYATGAIVPANTGVMVSALEGGNYTIQLTTGGTSLLGDNNMLKPSGDTGINAANMNVSDTKFYRLTMHNSTQIGFYWGAENGAAFDIAANKAYLAVPNTEAGARIGLWFGDDATGIANLSSGSSMNVNDSLNKVYDLQGRRVAHLGNGMYIINGKKFINK